MTDIRVTRRKYVCTLVSESEVGRKWMEEHFINPLPGTKLQIQNIQHEHMDDLYHEMDKAGLAVEGD